VWGYTVDTQAYSWGVDFGRRAQCESPKDK
jgi:hypothetical protein